MKNAYAKTCLVERRLSIERRSFSYSNHIPERRSGIDRRKDPQAVNQSERPSYISIVWQAKG
ncbi:MAG: hypothetical protein C4519_25380 [Desulfobacteraceae bacterium]|nr:MAG: hypothetical protein C4519_25380 [Desulfobacteraceae bacterium]